MYGSDDRFFYQMNYFKKEYSLEETFEAYLQYSGNSIGKLKTFMSEFRQDKSFMKYTDKLKALKNRKTALMGLFKTKAPYDILRKILYKE